MENLSGFAVWAFLILAFILFKDNRYPKALTILIPLIVVNLLWIAIKRLFGMSSLEVALFDVLFNAFTIGLTIVWLISHKFSGSNRFAVFVQTLIMMMLTFAVAIVGFKGVNIDDEVMQMAVIFCIAVAAVLLSFVMAALNCSRRYGAVKFTLWLGVWCVVLGALEILGFFFVSVLMAAASGVQMSIASQILQVSVMGLVFGGILCVLVMAFMIFVLNNDMFKKRFYGCFRLKGMLPEPVVKTETISSDDSEDTDFRYS